MDKVDRLLIDLAKAQGNEAMQHECALRLVRYLWWERQIEDILNAMTVFGLVQFVGWVTTVMYLIFKG